MFLKTIPTITFSIQSSTNTLSPFRSHSHHPILLKQKIFYLLKNFYYNTKTRKFSISCLYFCIAPLRCISSLLSIQTICAFNSSSLQFANKQKQILLPWINLKTFAVLFIRVINHNKIHNFV